MEVIKILYKPSNMSPSLINVSNDTFDFKCTVNCDGSSKVVAAALYILRGTELVWDTLISYASTPLYDGDTFTYTFVNTGDILDSGVSYKWYVRFYQKAPTGDTTVDFINIPMSYGYFRGCDQDTCWDTVSALKGPYDTFCNRFINSWTSQIWHSEYGGTAGDYITVSIATDLKTGDYVRYYTKENAPAFSPLIIDTVYELREAFTVDGVPIGGTGKHFRFYLNDERISLPVDPPTSGYHFLKRERQSPDIAEKRDQILLIKDGNETQNGLTDLLDISTKSQQNKINGIVEYCNESLIGQLDLDDNVTDWKTRYTKLSSLLDELITMYEDEKILWETRKLDGKFWYVSNKNEFQEGMYIKFDLPYSLRHNPSYPALHSTYKQYFKINNFDTKWFFIELDDHDGILTAINTEAYKTALIGQPYTILSTFMDSQTSVFTPVADADLTLTMPTTSFTVPSELTALGITHAYDRGSVSFTGTYTQEQNLSWRNFYFELWKYNTTTATSTLLKTSDIKTNGVIEGSFNGLDMNIATIGEAASLTEYYYIKFYITDSNGKLITTSSPAKFCIVYANNSSINKPQLSYDEMKMAAHLQWVSPLISTGTLYKANAVEATKPTVNTDAGGRKSMVLPSTYGAIITTAEAGQSNAQFDIRSNELSPQCFATRFKLNPLFQGTIFELRKEGTNDVFKLTYTTGGGFVVDFRDTDGDAIDVNLTVEGINFNNWFTFIFNGLSAVIYNIQEV